MTSNRVTPFAHLLNEQRGPTFLGVSQQMGLCIAAGLKMDAMPADENPLDNDEEWMPLVMQAHAWLGGGVQLLRIFGDERQLRAALATVLDINRWYLEDWQTEADLCSFTQMALEVVVYAVRDLAASFGDSPEGDWETNGLPYFMALHGFVTSVFLNTAAVLYPGKTLVDYTRAGREPA